MSVDAVTLNVVGKALMAISREMGANLLRAAYSTVVREARDCSVALLDARGDVVAQAEMIPMQTGGITQAFRALARRFDLGALTPDDALITNDAYDGGQHLQDILVFLPIFWRDRLVGFGGSVAHHLDIGGAMAGLNALATEYYQEGIRLPASRFSMSRDWNGGFVESFIRANVRAPEKTLGDLNAQFAANRTAQVRLGEVIDKYGLETTLACMSELMNYSERRIRAEIAKIPDGVYRGEDVVEGEPYVKELIPIVVTVRKAGTDIEADFEGTGPQAPGAINCPFASCVSAVNACVRGVLHEKDIPFNEGCNRPVTVKAPYGSLLNPRPPAAVRARMSAAFRVYNAMMRALAQAVPERVISAGFDTTTVAALSHLDRGTGRYGVVVEIAGGGYGAGPDNDGGDALDGPLSNCANAPVESLEIEYDYFRVDCYRLLPDSGGAGRCRGGLGLERAYEILKDGVGFSGYSDRFKTGAWGLFDAMDGASGAFTVERADGRREDLLSVCSTVLNRGDRLRVMTGGGGGYGDPRKRDGDLVLRDLREGKVSARHAREAYGVEASDDQHNAP
jgi:N-methylhydantoinase B